MNIVFVLRGGPSPKVATAATAPPKPTAARPVAQGLEDLPQGRWQVSRQRLLELGASERLSVLFLVLPAVSLDWLLDE